MNYLLFGGSGYVGTHVQKYFSALGQTFSTDLNLPGNQFCDVRKKISPTLAPFKPDWIILLAAVHREPGHHSSEYFETNIRGAQNVAEYAKAVGCNNIFFVSSISPYGPTPRPTDESMLPQPNSPYGISKYAAELTLQGWQKEDPQRRLIICRPGVIFGPKDPGNIGRTIHAIRKGYFMYPGNPQVHKSYSYIQGLLESMWFTIQRPEPTILYNYVERETETLSDLCRIVAEVYDCPVPKLVIPLPLLSILAHVSQIVTKGRSPIHPVRVRKAAMPTHIIPRWLLENGFTFKWNLRSALEHMKREEA